MINQSIREIDLQHLDETQYQERYVGCLVISQDNHIVLQKRGRDWQRFPDYLCEFGGRIENNESPVQAMIRELHEELGTRVLTDDLIFLGAITEDTTNHTELVYLYFWRDKDDTITGCYEGEAVRFPNADTIISQPKVMDSVYCLIELARKNHLL